MFGNGHDVLGLCDQSRAGPVGDLHPTDGQRCGCVDAIPATAGSLHHLDGRCDLGDLEERGALVDPIADTRVNLSGETAPVEDGAPVWSPDGEWLAFRRNINDGPGATLTKQLWLMRADGSEARPLTNDAAEVVCQKVYEDVIREFQKVGTKVVVRGTFWPHARFDRVHAAACKATGAVFVKIGHLGHRKEQEAHDRGFSHGGVAMHPGDLGMVNIADLVLQGIYSDEPAK